MRLLFCGDIVGRPGREAILEHVARLRRSLALDFVIANGENAAGGFGITEAICRDLFAAGVDVISGGNHIWDQRETVGMIDREPRLLRPLNFPSGTPGRGAAVYEAPGGRKVLVLNVMGRLFMDPLDDPFACVDRELAKHRLGATVQAIVVAPGPGPRRSVRSRIDPLLLFDLKGDGGLQPVTDSLLDLVHGLRGHPHLPRDLVRRGAREQAVERRDAPRLERTAHLAHRAAQVVADPLPLPTVVDLSRTRGFRGERPLKI